MSTTFQISGVEAVVERGWRRRLVVLAVEHAAPVLAALFGAFSLLIVLGTQILAWQWLVGLAVGAVVWAVVAVRREMPDPYRVAQMMDRRLALEDSLSTAWFIRHRADKDNQVAAAYQVAHAEKLAQTADPAAAFPFQRGRAWIVTGALFALAVGLFSARYLVTRELSLEHSFLPVALTQVFENVRNRIQPDKREAGSDSHQAVALPPAALAQETNRQSPNPRAESAPKAGSQPEAGAATPRNGAAPDQNAEQAKGTDGEGGDQKSNGAGDPSQSKPGQQASNSFDKQDAKQADANGAQRSESLVDRMRDALSSVMAKIKPTGTKQDSQSASQKNGDGQKSADQAGNKDQAGDGQKDAGKDQSAQEQNSGEQQGQGAAKAQASQGKDSAQSSDKKGSDSQSGVGHSDGDKELRAAEQAKAMGKLAEIIGKRSASLTGDMEIEPSGKQKLQTSYTRQQGQHADLGGEINRDEVPVEDQEYVREYMELVRKKSGKPQD